MWLDWDRAVSGTASQPFRLRWTTEEGEPRSHVPDYFAERGGGRPVVVDCRPADRRGPRDLAAFEATRRACGLAGWEYRLVGAPDPIATANLRWLSGYRHPRYGVAPVAGVLRAVLRCPCTTTATTKLHTEQLGVRVARFSGSALASHDSSGSRVYFTDADNHVHELAWVGSYWNTTDLTAVAKDEAGNPPPAAAAGSALASHDSSGSRVYFTDADNHVHELAWTGQRVEHHRPDRGREGRGGQPAAGRSRWQRAGLARLQREPGVLHRRGQPRPRARVGRQLLEHHRPDRGRHGPGGQPPAAAAGSALASHDSSGSRVYFTDADNHVHELAWVLAADWNTTDLTAVATGPAGSPPAAAAGSALASHDSSGSRVYFTDADNHVHELAWTGSGWNTTDLTAVATGQAGSPPAAAAGSALASHDSSGSRVYFTDADNHVHELAWTGLSASGTPPT